MEKPDTELPGPLAQDLRECVLLGAYNVLTREIADWNRMSAGEAAAGRLLTAEVYRHKAAMIRLEQRNPITDALRAHQNLKGRAA